MMIVKSRIRKIIFNWIINSDEYKLACVKNKELTDWVNKMSHALLSKEEIAWINDFGSEFYLHNVGNIDKNLIKDEKFVGKSDLFDYRFLSSYNYVHNNYELIYDNNDFTNLNLPKLDSLTNIEFEVNCPSLFLSKNFKEDYPDIYKKLKIKYKELALILCKLNTKLILLSSVLFSKDISLKSLKKYYKSLYDYSL